MNTLLNKAEIWLGISSFSLSNSTTILINSGILCKVALHLVTISSNPSFVKLAKDSIFLSWNTSAKSVKSLIIAISSFEKLESLTAVNRNTA